MPTLLDVIWVVAVATLFPNGDVSPFSSGFQTRAECMKERSVMIDTLKEVERQTPKLRGSFYIGECVAIPVTKLTND